MAHHNNQAHKALQETLELDRAVHNIMSQVDLSDTLVIVTSDHSHALTLNGYPHRGNDILGVAGTALDKATYTTLMYGTGYGHYQGRHNVTQEELNDKNYSYLATVPFALGN